MAEDLLKKYTFAVDTIKASNGKPMTIAFSQGDVKTAILIIDLTENDTALDLTGKKVRVSFKKSDGTSVMQDMTTGISILDAAAGKIQIELSTQALSARGNVRGQISISDEVAGLVSETAEFTFVVRESIINTSIVSSNELPIIEEMLEASEILGEVDLQTIVNNTNNVNSIKSEVETARGASANLAGRFSSVESSLAQKATEKYINQEDFVETLKRHTSPINMIITPNDVAAKNISVIYQLSEDRAIQHNIAKNQFDDYIMLLTGRVGLIQYNQGLAEKSNWTSRTGTWVDAKGGQSSYYASVVGATVTKEFFGSGLYLNFYGDTRGGVWEFVIDGDTQNKVQVSTYRATAGGTSALIFQQTTSEQHTVVGTFIGDDPLNPPSSGAGTARGWANWTDNQPTFVPTFTIYRTYTTVTNVVEPLFGASNKDFAFSIRKAGTTNPYYFCPWHTQPTAFKIEEPKLLVDGKEITLKNLESIDNITEFKVLQKIYGKVPETTENLIKVTTELTFSKDGTINIDGKMEVLTPTDIDWGYGIMTPINKTFAKKMITSLHNTFTAKSDGTNEYLVEENDKATSYLFINDSTYKNVGVGVRINNPKLSLRHGKTDKAPQNQVTFWQHRATGMNKLYNVAYNNTTLQTGETFRFSGTFIVTEFDGLYDLF
jgi:hypothetical protein